MIQRAPRTAARGAYQTRPATWMARDFTCRPCAEYYGLTVGGWGIGSTESSGFIRRHIAAVTLGNALEFYDFLTFLFLLSRSGTPFSRATMLTAA